MDLNGILHLIPFNLFRGLCTAVQPSFTAKLFCIAGKYFLIFAVEGYAHTELLMIYIVKIADKQKGFLFLLCLSEEHHHALLLIAAIDPLETIRIVIHLVQSRMADVQMIQGPHIILHLLVERILEQIPFQRRVFIPLVDLGIILAHKQKLFPRMAHHKSVSCPQVFSLFLQRFSWHLPHHGSLSMDYLIVGEY